jgi:hypothetical protein
MLAATPSNPLLFGIPHGQTLVRTPFKVPFTEDTS